ncbi:TPA: hypothetical protein SLF17_003147 [Serratia marcescens]|nr:hypothetical protein [Serratia marcescens]
MAGNTHTQAIGKALSTYFEGQGMTQMQVAAKYGISQSWVGRVYQGEFSKRAKSVGRMCKTAGIPFLEDESSRHSHSTTKSRLLRLLDSVWEGTDEDAKKLTTALLAIKKLRSPNGH